MNECRTRVLIVDDEPFILTATSQLLTSSGYATQTCHDWAGVASAIRDGKPDVVLLDYNMPSLKGDDLCTIIKRNMMNPGMRIYIYSSEPEDNLRTISHQCGADGWVKKDLPRNQLLEQLKAAIGAAA